jgi:hypothetical protein
MPVSYSWSLLPEYSASVVVPASYSWTLIGDEVTGALPPNPGPPVPSYPTYQDSRKYQFERGIKFANVPGGRADNVIHGGPRVYHVNSVMCITQLPCDVARADDVNISGVIKFRFKRRHNSKMPDSIRHCDPRGIDEYGNPVFSFTGKASGSV